MKSFIALSVLGASIGSSSSLVLSPQRITELGSLSSPLMIPRGGALLDPAITAKAFAIVLIADGIGLNCGPEMSLDAHGVKDGENNKVAQWFTERYGANQLANAVMMSCMMFQNTSLEAAYQVAWAIRGYQLLRDELSGEAAKNTIGLGNRMLLVIAVLQCYWMSQDYALTALKALSVFWALSSIVLIAAPKTTLQAWRGDPSILNDASVVMLDFSGHALLGMAALLISMLHWDATPIQGIGCFNVVWALRGIYKNVRQFHKVEFGWMLLHLVTVYAMFA